MTHYNQTTKRVTVAASTGTVRVWDNVYSTPVKNLTIIVRTSGFNIANITTEIFLGGHFEVGAGNEVTPYTVDSTHVGGLSQGSAAALGTGTEAAKIVYTNTGLLPNNNWKTSGILMPVVVKVSNTNASPVPVDITFVSESISSSI